MAGATYSFGAERSFSYQLGAAGNRISLNDTVNGASRTYAWLYDALYRLTNETISVTAPIGSISYRYDRVSNRTNRTSTVSGIGNQALSYGSNDWLTVDSYDSNGNTINSGSIAYQHDWANRLTNANNGAVLIVYDGDGNRLKKVAGGVTTLYLVDRQNLTGHAQVLEELTVSGGSTNLAKVYTYGLDLVSERTPNAGTNFFGYDGIGSTRLLFNSGGALIETYAYDAYGTLIASNGPPSTAYLFTGEQRDLHLGFTYNRKRYSNPNTGRFLTSDPFEGSQTESLTLHKYLYCDADPVNGTDPSGLWREIGSNFAAGKDAEVPVIADFIAKRGVDAAMLTSIHGILDYASTTGYKGVGRLIPDLVDVKAYEIYDVKSWNETPAGILKIEAYAVAFNQADPDKTRASKWHAGLTYHYGGPNPVLMPGRSNGKQVWAMYYPTEVGIIPYKLYEVDDDEDRKRIPIPVSVRARRPELDYSVRSAPVGNLIYANYYIQIAGRSAATAATAGLMTAVGIAAINAMYAP